MNCSDQFSIGDILHVYILHQDVPTVSAKERDLHFLQGRKTRVVVMEGKHFRSNHLVLSREE